MGANLVIAIRLHDGRYHGAGEEFPSPARCFQALVAAASHRGRMDETARGALEWLEKREPPVVCLPTMTSGEAVNAFVPNNDLDAKGGDPRRVEEIRVLKRIEPKLFDAGIPFIFAWSAGEALTDADAASVLGRIADRLYQFGRGVDMAWARTRILDDDQFEDLLQRFPGRVLRPSPGSEGTTLPCPEPGSLSSLEARFQAFRRRFRSEGRIEAFSQPPKPRFAQIPYGSPAARRLFEFQDSDGRLSSHSITRVVSLVESVRDIAAARLRSALPERSAEVDRVVIGRSADGASAKTPSIRARILPLPSIGHEHADRGIRRLLVETPPSCPLHTADVEWAFSALDVGRDMLVSATDESMLVHYGITGLPARRWRTVTPAALPEAARRRRIDPSLARTPDEAKPASERASEESAAVDAVRQALRHTEVRERVVTIRVQREPFESKGARAEWFAPGTRFAKERLWHVEVVFAEPIRGPLVIGDGRFLGLGLLAPVPELAAVHAFTIEQGLERTPDPIGLSRALRRAVMSRVQSVLGERAALAPYFTGHDEREERHRRDRRNGAPVRSEVSPHLAFVFDAARSRLLVIAPHVFERRAPHREERTHLRTLEEALIRFQELRAGAAGLLQLGAESIDPASDPLFAPSRVWESLTEYDVTRHAKQATPAEALASDLRVECSRRGLPTPTVTTLSARGLPHRGLIGHARLEFAVALPGPLLLGKSRFVGGGLFARAGSLASGWRTSALP